MNSLTHTSTQDKTELAERLVTLCDGRAGLRQGIPAVVTEPDSQESTASTLDFIASSEALDRYQEMICADGWNLENYRRNPVFQNAHQYGDVIFTLGKALITEVRQAGAGRVLFQRIAFATEVNPMARIAHGLYKGGFLNAVSVGFIPLRWETGSAESSFRRKYLEQELLEVSAVGIPANPEALQLGLKAGAIQKTDLLELTELLRSLADPAPTEAPSQSLSTAVPGAHAGASRPRNNEAQWLELARELKRILTRA